MNTLNIKWKYFASRYLKEPCFLEGSQASPVCLSGKSNIKMKMSFGAMILTGKAEVLGEKVSSIDTFPTTKSHMGSNPGRRDERSATNRLRHGTAFLGLRLSRIMFRNSARTAL